MPTISFYCVLCGTALHTSSESSDDLIECHSCSRHVPVPRPANLPGPARDYLPVFPPEVLELAVAFQCTHCDSRLRADARHEGRRVVCPDCGARTGVPRWSTVLRWRRTSEADEDTPSPDPQSPVGVEPATLSIEEMDFLSGRTSSNPEVAF